MDLVTASGPVRGTIPVPGSKSVANRALVCAALADGESRLVGLPTGDDTEAMIEGLRRFGVRIDAIDRDRWSVHGSPIEGGVDVDARLAGTTSRFLTAVAALGGRYTTVTGGEALRRRPMGQLHDALRSLGADVESLDEVGCLPVRVRRAELQGGAISMPGDVSSQFVSALMLIGPYLPGGLEIRLTSPLVSRPYVAMTASVMSNFGATGIVVADSFVSVEPSRYRGIESTIEPDASSASYPLAAAAITGGRVRVPGLRRDSWQGDVAIVDLLGTMGCRVSFDDHGADVEGGPLRGVDVDMSDVSDLVPTVAAVACFADSPTTISGVGFIRRKESDRIGDLVAGLNALGCRAEALADGLRIEPTDPSVHRGTRLSTHHDHRLAMAWSLLALRITGVSIDDPTVVAKSWPTWWDVRSALLASTSR
jgi:3-phosphoshikimate 1-carboxyvinyltransferase